MAPATPERARRRAARLGVALAVNLALVVAEAVAGVVAHSGALVANAGHDLTDAVALGLGLVAARLVLRSPTQTRSFGFHRATILAALANVGLLLVVTVLIVAVGVAHLLRPPPVDGGLVAVIGGCALAANLAAAAVLLEGRADLNVRAAVLHLAADAAASLGVLAAGIVIAATGRFGALDSAVSLAIAVLVAAQAVRLGRESVDILLEASPSDLDLDALRRAVLAVDAVSDVHDLHCWSISSDLRALSAHLVLAGHPTLESAQQVGEAVKATLASRFNIAHATLELECERCAEPEATTCAIDEGRTPAAPGAAGRGR
ncbi:MAG TPA: cation diffusion facilitator family transporter [Acidimicrobiales bacterium]|nr:cation diffusion facilitator family transporter [Acidimicrobiales bacterium]